MDGWINTVLAGCVQQTQTVKNNLAKNNMKKCFKKSKILKSYKIAYNVANQCCLVICYSGSVVRSFTYLPIKQNVSG